MLTSGNGKRGSGRRDGGRRSGGGTSKNAGSHASDNIAAPCPLKSGYSVSSLRFARSHESPPARVLSRIPTATLIPQYLWSPSSSPSPRRTRSSLPSSNWPSHPKNTPSSLLARVNPATNRPSRTCTSPAPSTVAMRHKFRGELGGPEMPVVFKCYGTPNVQHLTQELAAYTRVSALPVPQLFGGFRSSHENWVGLLLADVGVQIGPGDDWEHLGLTPVDKCVQLSLSLRLLLIFSIGRRSARRSAPSTMRVSSTVTSPLGTSSVKRMVPSASSALAAPVDHSCRGRRCDELKDLRDDLEI
ncbi:hypothetical protein B0H10DRAFT_285609 [Mycena sp. CBHHK59/15]|nr:hypothetical protein B0H10DRAFT_285609 [Mycena sp. CBHHK59/15]